MSQLARPRRLAKTVAVAYDRFRSGSCCARPALTSRGSQPMSYGYDFAVAARAPASERAAFIRRTYGHLAGAILAFAILETLLLQLPGIEQMVAGMFRAGFWIVLLAFLGVSFLARYWAYASPSLGMQYLGLGLYV